MSTVDAVQIEINTITVKIEKARTDALNELIEYEKTSFETYVLMKHYQDLRSRETDPAEIRSLDTRIEKLKKEIKSLDEKITDKQMSMFCVVKYLEDELKDATLRKKLLEFRAEQPNN